MSFLLNPYVFSDSRTFVSIWDTTITANGGTDANTIKLPIPTTDMFYLSVDWGDGTVNNSNTHTYENPGTKIVRIKGEIRMWSFNVAAEGQDKRKLREITAWGDFVIDSTTVDSVRQKFHTCTNLNLENVQGVPIIEGNNLTSFFQGCTSLRGVSGIDRWNFLPNTILFSMFYGNSLLNSPLIGQMKMQNVVNITGMLAGTTLFNQDISNWDVRNISSANNFMQNKTSANYNASYLDAIYNKWSQLPLKSGVTIGFGSIKYTSAGQAGRDILTTTYGWTITDGGI